MVPARDMTPAGLAAVMQARPVLAGVGTAAQALRLGRRELLHAGPPLADSRSPPPALLSSAVLTILYEGWASTLDEAQRLVTSGEVVLRPAQTHGCVTPLAFVVSPSTPLFRVESGAAVMHSPVPTVGGFDTRMGNRDPRILERLGQRDSVLAPESDRFLASSGPLDLMEIAAQAMHEGDDLHSRTTTATRLVAALMREAAPQLADLVQSNPLFFLTLWMAATACALRAGEGADAQDPTLVTRAGGNGESFGICLARLPGEWFCVPAAAPRGHIPASAGLGQVCPAIGDSAVIDIFGCGGQALAGAPEPLQALEGHVSTDQAALAEQLLCAFHPVLQRRVGLDAARVVEMQRSPLVAIAMLGADGGTGFVGRGVYRPPVELFQRAMQ
jgi:hypothetical protein